MALARQCPECGKQYISNARFCRADGARLVEAPSQPDAAAPVEAEDKGRAKPKARDRASSPDAPKPRTTGREHGPKSLRTTGGGAGRAQPQGDGPSKRTDVRRTSRRSQGTGADPMLGRVIAGRFTLEAVIGAGATGVVYRATHRALGRTMAVKVLKPQFIWDERSLQRFLREAKTCSLLDHPNIVYLYDFGRDDRGEPYLVMEFAEGETLHAAIQKTPTTTLPVERVLPVMTQVARALEHAHSRNVIHRDIKPENIVLTKHEGQDDWVKILDFGVARIVGHAPLTGHGQVTGTAEFIAPETLLEDGVVAQPVDMYAIGIIFHDALVGRPPFTGKLDIVLHQHLHVVPPFLSERSGDPSIPPELDELVARLLDKDPTKRPTAAELVQELEQLQLQSLLTESSSAQVTIPPPTPAVDETETKRITLHQRRTSIVPPPERKTEIYDRTGRPTQIVGRQQWPTRLSPNLSPERPTRVIVERIQRKQSEDRMADAESLSAVLHESAVTLANKLWASGWPQALLNLRQHIESCDQQDRQLATIIHAHEQQADRGKSIENRHSNLRHEILGLSERLRGAEKLTDVDRGRLMSDLETLERAFFAVDQSAGAIAPRAAIEPMKQRLLDIRATRRRSRMLFARLLLAMPCPAAYDEARQSLSELLVTVEQYHK